MCGEERAMDAGNEGDAGAAGGGEGVGIWWQDLMAARDGERRGRCRGGEQLEMFAIPLKSKRIGTGRRKTHRGLMGGVHTGTRIARTRRRLRDVLSSGCSLVFSFLFLSIMVCIFL